MIILNRQIDEWIVIGEKLRISPTDIDAAGARLLVRGELIGGADDGMVVDRSYELAVGNGVRLGTLVNLTLMKVLLDAPPRAQFGIMVPPSLIVRRKEIADQTRGEGER